MCAIATDERDERAQFLDVHRINFFSVILNRRHPQWTERGFLALLPDPVEDALLYFRREKIEAKVRNQFMPERGSGVG